MSTLPEEPRPYPTAAIRSDQAPGRTRSRRGKSPRTKAGSLRRPDGTTSQPLISALILPGGLACRDRPNIHLSQNDANLSQNGLPVASRRAIVMPWT